MSLSATILIPTHNHCRTLRASVASALRQTVADIEVLVIGDGVPDEARQIMSEIVQADPRVQFLDRPKGPRHGEVYRHEALAQARGRIVCYLSDDDLYLPRHVEEMSALLEGADFAHALATQVHPDESFSTWTVDLTLPTYQREISAGCNRIPLSAGAHTLEAYRRLDVGWTSAPPSEPTDQHMWRKFLAHPGCRFVAGFLPTVLVFPAPDRRHLSAEARFEELQTWLDRTAGESVRSIWTERILRQRARDAAAMDARLIAYTLGTGAPQDEFSLQLFLPAAETHSESNSFRFPIAVGEWATIMHEFTYPADSKVPLRIDPCDLPGLIRLAAVRLSAVDGTVLWQLDEETSRDVQVDGTAVLFSAGRELRLVSQGSDPQVLLPHIAVSGEESRVRVEFRVRLDADLTTLTALFAQR